MAKDASLQFGSVRLAGGLRLHYAESGESQGESIRFLHGWPDSWGHSPNWEIPAQVAADLAAFTEEK
jgi:pimeloyl-ACP methyl ester carboxylesterase